MESLCYSANKVSDDAYDVSTSLTVLGRDSQDLRCFSLVLATSRLWRQLHVVRTIKHERPSLQQMAKWRKLPFGVHWGLHVVVPRVHGFYERLISFFVLLPTRLSARCLLSSRPDTASIRSCLLLPPGFFDTREAGNCAVSRACFFFSFSSIGSACDGMWSLISGSHREMPLQALMKFEGPAITWNCFWVLPVSLSRCLHRSRPLILGTLGRAQNVLRLGALSVPSTVVDNDSTNLLKRWFVVLCLFHARTWLFWSQSTVGSFLFWCCLCCCVSYVRLGLSMETLLDSGRRFVQKRLCGRAGLHQRWAFWRTEHYRCSCAPQHLSQRVHPCDSQDFETIRFSTLGAREASR